MAQFPVVPINHASSATQFERTVTNVVNGIMSGRQNNASSVTLSDNTSTTTVTLADNLLTPDTVILFMPTTANAATEFAAGTMYVSSITTTTFVITHVNNGQTDRTFKYVRIG